MHRRLALRDEDVGFYDGIPVTSPAQTILDMTLRLPRIEVERLVDEADRLELIHPPELRRALEGHPPQPGIVRLRTWLDRRTFRLTRSKLERYFLPLAERAGLPAPETKVWVNGYEVDFHWPGLRFVVETDSLRFSHEQVRYEPARVLATLRPVARRLLAAAAVGGR